VFVVNKADRDGADATARDLRHMLSLVEGRSVEDWQPPIVKTVASRGEGIDEMIAALDKHHDWLVQSGRLDARRRVRAADEIEAIAVTALRARIGDLRGGTLLDELAGQVVAGELDPYAAADRLVDDVTR
jgi:LAO/AO transport system kinase